MANLVTRIAIISLGLLFLLPSAYKLFTYCEFRYRAMAVDGVVIDASRGRDLGGRPFVAYQDQYGNTYERKSRAKTHWFFAPQAGERVRVFYDKSDPEVAVVDSAFHYILLPLAFMACGVCFLFFGVKDGLRGIGHSP